MRQPRDYQQRAIEAARNAFRAGRRGIVMTLFTGAGKAYILSRISELVRSKGGRVLCLVNRDNLVEQLFTSLCEQGLHPTMERGADKASPLSDLVVGSVQSMQGDRLKKWAQDHFKMVITDEVHFAAAKTFKSVLDYFKSAFHLGVTATIERHDKEPLWSGYEEEVFTMPLTDGIEQGWLVPLQFKELPVPITLTDKENTKKIFGEKDEEDVFSRDSYLPRLFAESAKECAGRKALMFWPGCKASEEAASSFAALGIPSKHIDGYMSKNTIAEILEWAKDPSPKTIHCADLLCLDSQTEILTADGFVGIDGNIESLLIANWWQDGSVTFGRADDCVRRLAKSDEIMVSVETRLHNFRVTGNHEMVMDAQPGWKKRRAIDLRGWERFPTCGIAAPIDVFLQQPRVPDYKQRKRLITAQKHNLKSKNGLSDSAATIEAERRVDRKYGLTYKQPPSLTIDECRLIGFWVADGSCTKKKDGSVLYSMVQSMSYPFIIKWIDRVVKSTGISTRRVESFPIGLKNGIVTWFLNRGTGGAIVDKIGVFALEPYMDKWGSLLLWGLNEFQFDAIVEGYWHGDGQHGDAKNGMPRSCRFADTKLKWLELLQAIGSARGWRCDISRASAPKKENHNQQWYLRMIKGMGRSLFSTSSIFKTSPVDGERVWCVSVASGMIITKRRGKVTVMGNSYGYDNPSIDCIGIMRLSRSIPMLLQRIGRGTRTYNANVDGLATAEERKASIAASVKPSTLVLDLMLQLGDAQSSFATCGQLITGDKEEAEYVRKHRKTGVSIDLDEMRDLIKVKKSDDEKALTKLAEDAANAAERGKIKNGLPYYQHILKHYTFGKKSASEAQMKYLKVLRYDGPQVISALQASRLIDLFVTHKKGLKLV